MTTNTSSIRLSETLVADARRDAEVFNRTISGQVEHWARLGQAIEAAPGFDLTRVRAALDGRFNADLLSPDERDIFEDLLGEALATPDAGELAYFDQLVNCGGAVGYDAAGRYVRSLPGGAVEVLHEGGADAE
ncbi:MAG: hypothetical protein JSR64_09645 [Nitrospira sp.]|nr:hypothetical protein [Nitrospira sp.]MBS0194386.1 hypothetical protein [Pseudomonadota bacterium]